MASHATHSPQRAATAACRKAPRPVAAISGCFWSGQRDYGITRSRPDPYTAGLKHPAFTPPRGWHQSSGYPPRGLISEEKGPPAGARTAAPGWVAWREPARLPLDRDSVPRII